MKAQMPSRVLGRGLRTVVVVEDLNALHGPLTGRYLLPHHLDASARHLYDFADEQWRELAYRTDEWRRPAPRLLFAEGAQDGEGIADQRVDQRLAGSLVAPGDPRLAHIVVVVRGRPTMSAAPGTSRRSRGWRR